MSQTTDNGSAPDPAARSFKPLRAWLDRVGARFMWTVKNRERYGGQTILAYLINSKVVLVLLYGPNAEDGWDIYHQADRTNGIAAPLDAKAIWCGVDGCRELVNEEKHAPTP